MMQKIAKNILPLHAQNQTKGMHTFDYTDKPKELLTPDIVNALSALHEFRGKQEACLAAQLDILPALVNIAKIQSTQASNNIEGIHTSDERLKALVMDKAEPRNRSEEEIAGYREVLSTIHAHYEYIPIRPNTILQLHRDLYAFGSRNAGGRFKNVDNVITESGADGQRHVRFVPVPAFQTPEAIDNLCNAFNAAMQQADYDPLLLIPMFILDFLCIHPFNDGNGRMSRLLTLLLLYRSGYAVGKYISLEMLIEKSKDTYYEVLKAASTEWHNNHNNYHAFVSYYLGVIQKGYSEFNDRIEHLLHSKLSKSERVKAVFDQRLGVIKKSDIVALCPDISETTIERTLKDLLAAGFIEKVGGGRATGYAKK